MTFLTFPFFDLTTKSIITDILVINFLLIPHIPNFVVLIFYFAASPAFLVYSLSPALHVLLPSASLVIRVY